MATKLLSKVQKEDINRKQGVMSGIEALDKITGGFHNSNLVVLAGRPAILSSASIPDITPCFLLMSSFCTFDSNFVAIIY